MRWLFHMNSLPTLFWKILQFKYSIHVLSPNKKPKVNDVCVLFKYSKFWSRMLEMHSKRPRYQNVSRGVAPGSPIETRTFSACELCLWHKFFPCLPTPKLLPPTNYNRTENPDISPAYCTHL